jgi:uncharacterized delta-60 repeat protein
MPGYTKVSGSWPEIAPWGKVSGTWAKAKEAYANVSGTWRQWWLDGGVNDRTFTEFDIYSGFNTTARTIAIQSDGKIVIGGDFTTFNSATVNRIVRLNSDGTRDAAFTTNTGTAFNSGVNSIAIQSDGKIICGGSFTTFNGTTVNCIVRLNSDGTRDTTFTTNTGTAFESSVNSIAIQSDGKIIIGGDFENFNGTTVNHIVRLNSDGTRDTTFTTNTGTAFESSVNSIAIQSDGKIICGGSFITFNGTTVNHIVRLNSDGTTDATFVTNTGTGSNGVVNSIAIQTDGKILIGGWFTAFNGTANRIVRLNSDGTKDTLTIGSGFNNEIRSIAIQSDGKIIIGGNFSAFNGTSANFILRLNSDGTRDTSFSTATGVNSTVFSVAIQSDGKVICGGAFTSLQNAIVNRIGRLNSNGTRDTSMVISSGFDNSVLSIAIQPDSKIICGGSFTIFNVTTVNRIVRLNSDGTRDTTFTTNTGTAFDSTIQSIAIQPDGKIIVVGQFLSFNFASANRIARLNPNGTLDTTFVTNTGTGFNGTTRTIAVQSDGKIIIGGDFNSFNGAPVNRIVRLNSDGTRDTTFSVNAGAAFNSSVNSIVIQSDGKIICGGGFTTFNGTAVSCIVRLNSDATLDTTFTTNTGTAFDNSVFWIAIQSDGKIVIGGNFTTFNGATVNRIVRLNSDGTRDTTFTTNTGTGFNTNINSIAIQSDGKIICAGAFTTFNGVSVNRIVRLNSDGTRHATFTTNTGTAFSGIINSIAIQSDSKILCGGAFTGFNSINRTRLARIGGE